MNGFRFRLQKVLDLRERLERESATALAAARNEAAEARQAMEALQHARERGVVEAGRTASASATAGELQRIALLIEHLDEHLAVAESAHREAGDKVNDLAAAFERALTERQVIERLRERKLADWRGNEDKRDQALMDAVAVTRYARKVIEEAK
jgi:flagellar FliJ protein